MDRHIGLILILLIINTLITILYLIWGYIRRKENVRGRWMKAVMMLLCPVIGPSFLVFSYCICRAFFAKEVDLADVVFSKERVKTVRRPDEEIERNLVSMEEALAVTDKKNLRTYMMNVLQRDYRESLSMIAKALNSEDTETSHYAASVLQDVLNEFRVHVDKKLHACQAPADKAEETDGERETRICTALELLDYMNVILEQHVFTGMEQTSMVWKMDEVCDLVWQADRTKLSSEYYGMVEARLLEQKLFQRCEVWCNRCMEQYPGTLVSYTGRLSLYFSSGNRERFFAAMEELKASDVMIDQKTLELIRIFM